MPELPEVETTRRGIEPWVVGATLTDFKVHNPSLRWPVELPAQLRGARINSLQRRAKYLLLDTTAGTLILHLGMSGSLRWCQYSEERLLHDHVEFEFAERVLRFNDPRRFGCVLFHAEPETDNHPLLRHLGVEPLGNEFNGQYLFERSRRRKIAVKNFIMDGKVVVGVGNIYAAESLFLAGIRPAVAAGRVTRAGYEQLSQAIRTVLSDAITQGGTTLRDFVGSDGRPGYFKQRLYVYGREREPCRICGGDLKLTTLGQRSTVFCPRCQTFSGFRPLAARQA
ncbi:MAG: bifunctional DNA-formamidopyrimidine glycosylase/DNA-(apurinic or apyrimidinic site) lyase [Pseudomonadales bacterium]